jgi:hypothetical protein
MIQLITKADLPDYTRMSVNIADALINPAIRDAHTFDVLPHFSPAELGNLVAYLALDETYRGQHPAHVLYQTAVRPLLCYQAYRRFLLDAGVHITPNSIELTTDRPVSSQQRAEMRADAAAKCSYYDAVLASALRAYRGPATPSTTCGGSTRRRPATGGLRTSTI